jgi:hypothetical protein
MRYYHETLGRFASRDRSRRVTVTRFYSYANLDPLNSVDSLGLATIRLNYSWMDEDWPSSDQEIGSVKFEAKVDCDSKGNVVVSSVSHDDSRKTNFWWGASYVLSDASSYDTKCEKRKGSIIHFFTAISTDGGYLSWGASGVGGAAGWFLGTLGGSPTGIGAVAAGLAGAGIGAAGGAALTDWLVGASAMSEAKFLVCCCCLDDKGTRWCPGVESITQLHKSDAEVYGIGLVYFPHCRDRGGCGDGNKWINTKDLGFKERGKAVEPTKEQIDRFKNFGGEQ